MPTPVPETADASQLLEQAQALRTQLSMFIDALRAATVAPAPVPEDIGNPPVGQPPGPIVRPQ